PTVAELGKKYLDQCAKLRPGTVRGYREMLRDIVVPRLGHLRVSAVGKRDVAALHEWANCRSERKTPYRANRALALISAMFNWAIESQWCGRNPAKGVERFPEDEREFWLTEEQLAAFDRAIDEYGRDCGEAIRLLILTGAREMEVLGAMWTEFDVQRAFWTKPSHHTKEKKVERLPVSEAALIVLRRMKKRAIGPCLFPGKFGADAPRVTIRKPWIQICKAAGLATEYKIQGKRRELTRFRPNVRIHDLRHTYASWLVNNGVPLKQVGKLLGHTQERTTSRYSHLADKSLRSATNTFGESLKWVS
ncbi:MAG: site-specific integrase, partial [Terriglobales bacterium]